MQAPLRRLYLLYHELRHSSSDYSYIVDAEIFKAQIGILARLRNQQSPSLWPEITFDDGHISNFEVALPVLQSHNIRAWFFITVGWTGQRPGYMGWQELRTLHQAGQLIGAHGWTHTLLTHCTPKELHHELTDARLALEDKLGTSITVMSLPGGRYNRRILDACREAGYTSVYTSIPKAQSDPASFTIGRLNIRGDMTPEWVSSVFQPGNHALSSLERQYQFKSVAKSILGDRLYEKLWAVANRKEPETNR